MTRGRKKDLTIPPSRALAHQRDYRARKAQYIADLEERCRRAEQENAELRKQLEIATAGFPSESAIGVCNAETAQLTSDLLQHLGAASASLLRFQQLTTNGACRPEFWPQQNYPSGLLRPANFPSSSPSLQNRTYDRRSGSERHGSQEMDIRNNSNPPESEHDRSPSVGSECCGGILDCHDLVDEGDFGPTKTECVRTSELRSTSEPKSREGISSGVPEVVTL